MFKKVLKNVAVEPSSPVAVIPRISRIIPAEKVIMRQSASVNINVLTSDRYRDGAVQASQTTSASELEQQDISAAIGDYDSILINRIVERRVKEFEQRFQEEKEHAFREGIDQGRKKGHQEAMSRMDKLEKLLNNINDEFVSRQKTFQAEGEKVVARLVIEIAEAIVGEAVMKSSRELLDFNLKRCLEVLGGSGKVTIRINPSDYEFAEEELLSKLGKDSEKFFFTFEPDPAISPGGCFIETDGGAIDARIESQFDQIKNSFLQLV